MLYCSILHIYIQSTDQITHTPTKSISLLLLFLNPKGTILETKYFQIHKSSITTTAKFLILKKACMQIQHFLIFISSLVLFHVFCFKVNKVHTKPVEKIELKAVSGQLNNERIRNGNEILRIYLVPSKRNFVSPFRVECQLFLRVQQKYHSNHQFNPYSFFPDAIQAKKRMGGKREVQKQWMLNLRK